MHKTIKLRPGDTLTIECEESRKTQKKVKSIKSTTKSVKSIKSIKSITKPSKSETKSIRVTSDKTKISPYVLANKFFTERAKRSESRSKKLRKERLNEKNNEITSLREQLAMRPYLNGDDNDNNYENLEECVRPETPQTLQRPLQRPQIKQIKLNKFTILPLINDATRSKFMV